MLFGVNEYWVMMFEERTKVRSAGYILPRLFIRSIRYLQSLVDPQGMQDRDAEEEPRLKQLAFSERTADRPHDAPNQNLLQPCLPFIDPETASTRPLNLASSRLELRGCYQLHSGILEGSAISQNMRARLRSFITGESAKQCLLRETCVLACNLVDLFFAQGGRVEVSEFQSLVIGCLILATKIKEGKLPTIAFNIFCREQLLTYERKVARKLAYNLTPPTYHDYAQRAVILWDVFTSRRPHPRILPLSICSHGVNLRLRKFYEQLDCVFMVLKSLDFHPEVMVINLLYLFLHMEAIERPDDPAAISDEKFKNAFYSPRDAFRKHYQGFLDGYEGQGELDLKAGLVLRHFLKVEPAQRHWHFSGNEEALQMMRIWDRIQTSPKDNYSLAKSVIERLSKKK